MVLVLKELEEITKCPICLNILTPPLCYCENGHYICSLCLKDVTICPTCRANFVDVKTIPTLVTSVLSIVPKDCKYFENGCKQIMSPHLLKEHEEKCQFRKVHCRMIQCSWEGTIISLLNHLRTHHPTPNDKLLTESNVYISDVLIDQNHCSVSPIIGFNCIFWVFSKLDTNKGKFMIFCVCVPTKFSKTCDFYSVITFANESPYVEYKYTQKIFDESVNTDYIFSCENCMIVPLLELPHFIGSDGRLEYHYKIFRRNEPNVLVKESN